MANPWADQPFSLIPTPTEEQTKDFDKVVIAVAREMCLAHNAMIRNLNAIYLQCEQITVPKDQADFIIFCQAAIEVIHTHHQMEEANFFPQIAEYTGEPDIMEKNIEQHRAFDTGLTVFEGYIYKLTPEKYDAVELKRLLDGFAKVLVVHLSDEIQTLLALQKYGGEKLAPIFENFNNGVMKAVKDKHRLLPCALGCIDRTFEGGKNADFPPFPFFVPYLVKYYFARRYSGSWRFTPCTMFGQPRPLEFTRGAVAA